MGALEVYRYERKFLVSERDAESIRQFVCVYLEPDRYMAASSPGGYRVCSLYLDTPQLALYRQSVDGIKNRYKLRIRFYDDAQETPAFLEIKKRTTENVHKLRVMVAKSAVEPLLVGRRPSVADMLSNSDTSYRALSEFCDSRERLGAEGLAFVDYRREAFVSSAAENVRATFDRQITGCAYRPGSGLGFRDRVAPIPVKGVVLELKYNGRAPRWMHDLVSLFSLQRLSFPKYVHCVDALGLASNRSFTEPRLGVGRHELV
jgi:hypothetical protein